MRSLRILLLVAPLVAGAVLLLPGRRPALRVGSKGFTEAVILGEMLTQLARSDGAEVHHRAQLGGTRVLWSALRAGEIDLYPEYTGTIAHEILADQGLTTEPSIRAAVERLGLRMSRPLGFNNSYAVGMQKERAAQLGITRISDLRKHPELRLGFTNEFMDRSDGWPTLREHYLLPHKDLRGLDHDLAYPALATGSLDATDLYTTDAKIRKYDLAVLEDDAQFFPTYHAVILYRASLAHRAPLVVDAIRRLEGTLDESTMVDLNAQVELAGTPEPGVAANFISERLGVDVNVNIESPWSRFLRHTRAHLRLVISSLVAALIVSIPLGIWAAKRPTHGQVILGTVGIIQTIPALALLVVLMQPLSAASQKLPFLQSLGVSGIGNAPAIVALFLYSLLPIVRNTVAGLKQIAPELREAAAAMGLPASARLRLIELPLAGPTILAGIKTAAVINIGFATLGALIGAGGYGQPILTGIRLNDYGLILQGAVPAALLALLAQAWFELAEWAVVPCGLRLKPAQ